MKPKEERLDRLLRLRRKYRDGINKIDIRLKKLGARVRDPRTANEFQKRDPIIQKIFFIPWMCRIGISANHISYLGFILVTVYNALMALGLYPAALITGFLGILTDIVDGPRARYIDPRTGKDNITGWGTFLDHTRDYYFALSFGLDAFFRFGHAAPVELVLAALVSFIYFLILVFLVIKYQLWSVPARTPIREMFSRQNLENTYRRFCRFSLSELQTDLWGRVQFITLVGGVLFLFLGKYLAVEPLIHFSYAVFGGTITIGFVNILFSNENEDTAGKEDA